MLENNITPEEDFNQEIICTYKDEKYSVRNNGGVLRHPRENGRKRPTDNKWFFGKLNAKTGYLEIASVRVHRIVATAFFGEPPTKEHVVDHKDTNKQNNRPENLRWVTRLENILLNPITVKRIESACSCTIDEFLANIESYREILSMLPPDIQWMRNVSRVEGKACLENLTNWAKSDKPFKGKSIGDWIYRRGQQNNENRIQEVFDKVMNRYGIVRKSLTSNKAMRGKHYVARMYAAQLLRSELNLSNYEIGKLLGLSTTTIGLYLDVSTGFSGGD